MPMVWTVRYQKDNMRQLIEGSCSGDRLGPLTFAERAHDEGSSSAVSRRSVTGVELKKVRGVRNKHNIEIWLHAD